MLLCAAGQDETLEHKNILLIRHTKQSINEEKGYSVSGPLNIKSNEERVGGETMKEPLPSESEACGCCKCVIWTLKPDILNCPISSFQFPSSF